MLPLEKDLMQHRHAWVLGFCLFVCLFVCWSLLYSAILWSLADSLRSHVILYEWLAFYSAFLNIHRGGVRTCSADMAGATWNCCLLFVCPSAFSVCLCVLCVCFPNPPGESEKGPSFSKPALLLFQRQHRGNLLAGRRGGARMCFPDRVDATLN